MGIKLFVDDIRKCPENWVPARSVTEAIRILATQDISEISLDHDIQCLGEYDSIHHSSPETFEPVAWFLSYFDAQRTDGKHIKVRIHTSNFEAGKNMAKILMIKDYQPYFYNEKDYA